MVAADLIETAGFDAASAHQNLDSFATAISDRGMGFRESRLMAPAPCCANVVIRNGVSYESVKELLRHS